jgi:hypothetical protein
MKQKLHYAEAYCWGIEINRNFIERAKDLERDCTCENCMAAKRHTLISRKMIWQFLKENYGIINRYQLQAAMQPSEAVIA